MLYIYIYYTLRGSAFDRLAYHNSKLSISKFSTTFVYHNMLVFDDLIGLCLNNSNDTMKWNCVDKNDLVIHGVICMH